MSYTKISPLGKRDGLGTFDTFYDNEKYHSLEEATTANDVVVVDFVRDDGGVIHFEFYNTQRPETKKYHRLEIQHFPAGIDIADDQAACGLAVTLF